MRIQPAQPVILRSELPKYRAFPSIRNGLPDAYAIIDTITRERIPCESEAELWEKFNEVQARGVIV